MRYFLPFVFGALIISSCQKEDGGSSSPSKLDYRVMGGPCGGAFEIEDDGDPATLEFIGVLYPATDDNPEVVFITCSDPVNGRQMFFQLPAEQSSEPIEITRDNEYFGLGIQHEQDSCALTSGTPESINGVSVTIHKLKRGNSVFGDFEMDVHFEGFFSFTNAMGQHEEFWVDGNLHYSGLF